MVIPDKLLLDEVNKKDMVEHNEIFVQANDFPDVKCNATIYQSHLYLRMDCLGNESCHDVWTMKKRVP